MMQDTADTAAIEDRNAFRRALNRGRPLVGTWSMLNSSNVIEGLGECGFDWVLIDGEHSPISLADMIGHLRAIAASDTVPIVRLPWNDPVRIKQALDIGATTLMLPYVQSAGEAQAAVAAMRYPPEGVRGVAAMHRASRFGANKSYLAGANAGLALIVQIETKVALDQVEAIAATPGVDAVFFGPGDLAATMGLLGRPAEEPVVIAIKDARRRLRGSGVRTGVLAPSPELAEGFIREGFDFVSVANDAAMLFSGATAAAAHFRTIAEELAPR